MDLAQPRSNRRLSPRRATKRSSKITCRKGVLGLGPDLAIRLLDLSETGVRLVIKAELKKGEEVEIGLLPPGGSREVIRKGQVAWSVTTADGECCVGVSFWSRLDYSVLSTLWSASN